MTTYYVSQSGNNGNGLSLANAKTTIAAGIGLMSGSDQLLINTGTYVESILNTIPSGSSGARTIVKALNEPTVGSKGQITATVILRPSSPTEVIRVTNPYVALRGLDLNATDAEGPALNGYNGSVPFNGMLVEYCRLHGANTAASPGSQSGIIGDFANSLFRQNEIDHNGDGTTGGGNSNHGVYLAKNGNTVEDNYIHHNEAYAVHLYPFGASSNIIRRNRCERQGSRGLIIYGNGNLFYNNICDTNAWGLEVLGDDNGILCNTFYGNGSGSFGIWISGGNANKIQDNILYANAQNVIQDDGSNTVIDHNLFTNPQFVDAANGDFHLQSTSPAINAAVDLSSYGFNTDFYGNVR